MVDGFQFMEKLGSGAFGSVYFVQRDAGPAEVIKALQKKQFESFDAVRDVAANVRLMAQQAFSPPERCPVPCSLPIHVTPLLSV